MSTDRCPICNAPLSSSGRKRFEYVLYKEYTDAVQSSLHGHDES